MEGGTKVTRSASTTLSSAASLTNSREIETGVKRD